MKGKRLFRIEVYEVHLGFYEVEADTVEQALSRHSNGWARFVDSEFLNLDDGVETTIEEAMIENGNCDSEDLTPEILGDVKPDEIIEGLRSISFEDITE